MNSASTTLYLGLCAALLAGMPAQAGETAAPAAAEPAASQAASQSASQATPQTNSQAAPSPFDVVKMPGGVEYRELAVGTGAAVYPGSTALVQYTGWLRNPDGSRGTQFDSSRNTGLPLEFVLGDGKVIRGWEIGMAGMKVGGKRRLFVPPSLAYGAKGTTSIPPYSTLIFDVELVGVK